MGRLVLESHRPSELGHRLVNRGLDGMNKAGVAPGYLLDYLDGSLTARQESRDVLVNRHREGLDQRTGGA